MEAKSNSTSSAPSSYWLERFARQAEQASCSEERKLLQEWYTTILGPYVSAHSRFALDIGCGRGRVIRAVAALAPECVCVGIDGNDATLEVARRELNEDGIARACTDWMSRSLVLAG